MRKFFGYSFRLLSLAGLLSLGYLLYNQTMLVRELKEDYAAITNIRYGLLNLDLWKSEIEVAFTKRIDELDISREDLEQLRPFLKNTLDEIYEKEIADARVGWDGRWLMKRTADWMFDLKETDRFVEYILTAINKTLQEEDWKNELRNIIVREFESFAGGEATQKLVTEQVALLEKYGGSKEKLRQQVSVQANEEQEILLLSLGGVLLVFLSISMTYGPWFGFSGKTNLLDLTILGLILLIFGISMPTIDIDARMTSFGVQVYGTSVQLPEQQLFFQSKSILDVIWILLKGDWLVMMVGVLTLAFSVLFPLAKLLASFLVVYVRHFKQNRMLNYMVQHLGKWSMADVFTLAIFMAFIGFNGLVDSQMAKMGDTDTETVEILNTNHTIFRPGLVFFTLYCLVSIYTAGMIRREQVKEALGK